MTTALPERRRRRLSGTRRTIADRLTEAWTAPAFHLSRSVDVAPARARVAAAAADAPVRLTLTDELVRCCALALAAEPALNAHLVDDEIVELATANVGLAVAAPAGLTVPVLHDAGARTLAQLGARRAELVERAHARRLTADDLAGATFTVSNLGMFGIERFDAILHPPAVAILAVGAARAVPLARDGALAWQTRMELTLTCDHRAVDGAEGARFLGALADALEAEG